MMSLRILAESVVEILLKTLFRGIESTLLNPRNANNLWERMKNSIATPTPEVVAAIQNLTNILRRLSSKASFSSTDAEQIKVSIEQILSGLFGNNSQAQNIPFSANNSEIRFPSTVPGSSPFQTATPSRAGSVGSVDAFGVPLLADQSVFVSPNASFNSQTGPTPAVTQFQQQNLDNNSLTQPLSPEVEQLIASLVEQFSQLDASANANRGLQFGDAPEQGSLMGSSQASPQRSVTSSQGSAQSLNIPSAPPLEDNEAGGPQFGLTDESELFEDAQAEDNQSGTFPDLNIPSGLAKDVLQQIFNSNIRLQNKALQIDERTLNTIDNMLAKNMNLSKTGVRLLANRMNYAYWAKIMYLGGEYFSDNEFLTSIQDMKVSMKTIVEKMMNLQNTGDTNIQKPNKAFLREFFFSSNDDFRALRGQIYKSQIPTRILGTPTGKSPVKNSAPPSTTKKMQNLAQRLFTPSKSPAAAAGAKSGRGLKHTGLKTVKQIISRTENLIHAANLGNKSTEVRNELDTLLAVLIDRKEVRPEFRTKLMKKLF